MFESIRKRKALRALLLLTLLISTITVGSFAAYALQSLSIPLEVKEPLEVIDYPSGFSLFPGENVTFEITVKNLATVTYFTELDFRLNDTEYQTKYVTFSNHNYSIPSGTQKLSAWLTIAPTAPPANLIITVERKTGAPSPSPTASPQNDSNVSLTPSLRLLSGGARWAAQRGKNALYVNWRDNWAAHHSTNGADWDWYFSESIMAKWTSSITIALEHAGFEVTLAGDIPDNLSSYDLVVISAYYAVEPRHEPLIRDYVFNGGSVIFWAGAQCYLTGYSKTLSGGSDLTSIQEWFGCRNYVNSGGTASPAFDNPFGTSFSTSDILFTGTPAHAGVASLSEDSRVVATWSTGTVFAFTHEYGDGRLYYQAIT